MFGLFPGATEAQEGMQSRLGVQQQQRTVNLPQRLYPETYNLQGQGGQQQATHTGHRYYQLHMKRLMTM